MFLIESLLLESRIEFLRNQFSDKLNTVAKERGVDADRLWTRILQSDPTTKKEYLQWILRELFIGRISDIGKVHDVLAVYHQYKPKLSIDNRDVNKVTFNQMDVLVKQLASDDSNLKTNRSNPYESADGIDTLYFGPHGALYEITDKEGSMLIGRGTKWCTSATSDEANQYARYSQLGSLYVYINHRGSKYQFQFETSQFKDARDKPISPKTTYELVHNNPVLRKFFIKQIEYIYGEGLHEEKVAKVLVHTHAYDIPELKDVVSEISMSHSVVGHYLNALKCKVHTDEPDAGLFQVVRTIQREIPDGPTLLMHSAQMFNLSQHPIIENAIFSMGDYDNMIAMLASYTRYVLHGVDDRITGKVARLIDELARAGKYESAGILTQYCSAVLKHERIEQVETTIEQVIAHHPTSGMRLGLVYAANAKYNWNEILVKAMATPGLESDVSQFCVANKLNSNEILQYVSSNTLALYSFYNAMYDKTSPELWELIKRDPMSLFIWSVMSKIGTRLPVEEEMLVLRSVMLRHAVRYCIKYHVKSTDVEHRILSRHDIMQGVIYSIEVMKSRWLALERTFVEESAGQWIKKYKEHFGV